jgi:phosphoadenosine phosphosulfate reductase
MKFKEMSSQIQKYLSEDRAVFVSSSFQTHSIPLLHMISRISPEVPVAFLNTGFLFPETLEFRDQVLDRLGLELLEVTSSIPKSQQRDPAGRFFFHSDPDRCFNMNKVQPMEELLWQYDVWINGVRADQSAQRKSFEIEQPTPQRAIRFHPMLAWTSRMIHEYRVEYNLPEHPLEAQGYFSVGCEPCTQCMTAAGGRDGRWFGQKKTECGLHTDLVARKKK